MRRPLEAKKSKLSSLAAGAFASLLQHLSLGRI